MLSAHLITQAPSDGALCMNRLMKLGELQPDLRLPGTPPEAPSALHFLPPDQQQTLLSFVRHYLGERLAILRGQLEIATTVLQLLDQAELVALTDSSGRSLEDINRQLFATLDMLQPPQAAGNSFFAMVRLINLDLH